MNYKPSSHTTKMVVDLAGLIQTVQVLEVVKAPADLAGLLKTVPAWEVVKVRVDRDQKEL